jgi:hypothetical protein
MSWILKIIKWLDSTLVIGNVFTCDNVVNTENPQVAGLNACHRNPCDMVVNSENHQVCEHKVVIDNVA